MPWLERAIDAADATEGLAPREALAALAGLYVLAGRPALVLEVGTHKGRTAVLWAALGARVVCVDDFSGRWVRDANPLPDGAAIRSAWHAAAARFPGRMRLVDADCGDHGRVLETMAEPFRNDSEPFRNDSWPGLVFIDVGTERAGVRANLELARAAFEVGQSWSRLVKVGQGWPSSRLVCGRGPSLPGVRAALDEGLPGWRSCGPASVPEGEVWWGRV